MNAEKKDNTSSLIRTRPSVSKQQAVTLATRLFNLSIADYSSVKELDSYDDRNFFVRGLLNGKGKNVEKRSCQDYVLKVVNHVDSNHENLMQTQCEAMLFLQSRGHACPVPVSSIYDNSFVMCKIPIRVAPSGRDSMAAENEEKGKIEVYNGEEYSKEAYHVCAVRLLTFVPGKLLHEIPLNTQILFDAGVAVAKLDRDLKDFGCPKLERDEFVWSLATAGYNVETFLDALDDHHPIEMIRDVCESFRKHVLPKLHLLPKQVIHGDPNYTNIVLIQRSHSSLAVDFGFIDFGDINYSCRVFDVAMSLTYILNHPCELNCGRLQMAGHFFSGFQSVNPLSNEEIELLPVLIASRFCQTLVYGTFTNKYLEPDNTYVLETAEIGWKNFQTFWKTPKDEVLELWLQLARN